MSHTYTLFRILDNNEFDNLLKYFMLLFKKKVIGAF